MSADASRPFLVHPADLPETPGPATSGMDRRQLLHDRDRWVGLVTTTPGLASGWHHHGEHDSYIFVSRGAITIEYGPGGRDQFTGGAGDFIMIPAGIVHRETTGPEGPAEVFLVRVGTGELNVNVGGPDPDA